MKKTIIAISALVFVLIAIIIANISTKPTSKSATKKSVSKAVSRTVRKVVRPTRQQPTATVVAHIVNHNEKPMKGCVVKQDGIKNICTTDEKGKCLLQTSRLHGTKVFEATCGKQFGFVRVSMSYPTRSKPSIHIRVRK